MRDVLIGLLTLLVLAAVTARAQAEVAVSGACRCPKPPDVQTALGRLENRRAPKPPLESTALERYDAVLTCRVHGTVDVVLQRAGGEPIADRALAARGSCRARASAIAVIIGAWEADIDPHISPSVALSAVAISLPVAPSSVSSNARRSPAPAAPPTVSLSAGVGMLASFAGGQAVPGAMIAADVLPRGGHLGLATTITATMSRDSSIGSLSGAARWSRVTAGVGPDMRFDLGATRLDLQMQGVVAALSVTGSGIPSISSENSPQLGGALALRASWELGTSAIWAGAQALVFPGNDRLVVQGVTDQGRLPHVELQLAAGMTLGRFP